MVSLVKALPDIRRIIPALVIIASCIGCQNEETPPKNSISIAQRTAAIESAMVHLDAGNIHKSLAITTQLVSKDDANPQSFETHALVLLALSNISESDGDLTKAKEERLKSLEAYKHACKYSDQPGLLALSTAQVAQMLDDDATAIEYYTKAHRNVENDGRAAFFLAQIEMLKEEWLSAKSWIDESKKRNPFEPFTLVSSALIEAQLGNNTVAIELAREGCEILPSDMNLRFIQARIFRLANQPTRALEILKALPLKLQNSSLGQEEIFLCNSLLENQES